MKAQPKPHRIRTTEGFHGSAVAVSLMSKGEVFVRHGTAHMAVEPPADVLQQCTTDGHVWVVNLVSGACWLIPEVEQVHPAYDCHLSFNTTRRET